MAFFRLALLFCLLYGSGAVSIQESLQSVQDILNSLKDKQVASDKPEISDLKTELKDYIDDQKTDLKEYIDDQINMKSKMELKYDVVLRGFMTEKKLRKQLEARVRSIEIATKEKAKFIEGMIDDKDIKIAMLQKEIEHLKKDASRNNVQTVNLKTETSHLQTKVNGIVTAIQGQIDKAQKKCDNGIENVRERLTASISNSYSELGGKLANNSKRTASIAKSYNELDDKIADMGLKLTNSLINVQQIPKRVAFSARVAWGKSYADLDAWQTVVFSQVSLNIGNAYSGTTGEFTAPFKGVYAFHVHITGTNNKVLEISLKKNQLEVLFMYVKGPGHGSDSGAITIHLNVGDVVKVVKHGPWGERPFYVHGSFSSFTGFLLYEE